MTSSLLSLADRLEAATEGQQPGLIWEAGYAVFGRDEPTDSHSKHAWFVVYAQAEAWTDAAMLLVPEGWGHGYFSDDAASVFQRNERGGYARIYSVECFDRPIALALAAAALRARAAQ